MSDKTGIEWTDATWNPTKGCDRVSPGCDNCYALTQAKRLKGMGSAAYQLDGDSKTSGPGFLSHEWPLALDQPLRWTKPRRIFVNSMSDLFHDNISDEFIAQVWAVMALAPRHTFQILTKRHARMRSLLSSDDFARAVGETWMRHPSRITYTEYPGFPLPNVWLGVSTENQQWADIRIPALLATPAAVRFISAEPLLGPIDLLDVKHLDWVIVGGESGPGSRPMHPDWARSIRNQCENSETAFLFKQWGEYIPVSLCRTKVVTAPDGRDGDVWLSGDGINHQPWTPDSAGALSGRWHPFDDAVMRRVGKHAAGRLLDGRTWDEYPVGLSTQLLETS